MTECLCDLRDKSVLNLNVLLKVRKYCTFTDLSSNRSVPYRTVKYLDNDW